MRAFDQQLEKFRAQGGAFIAALDQSGGSTPKALGVYGINPDRWSNEEEMFDLVHKMRSRIISNPAFNGDRILAAILFEKTMDRSINGQPTADYLWNNKGIVPILKVDQGLEPELNGVQLMKPMAQLGVLLAKAKSKHIFGTKMRSVIHHADPIGIPEVVEQQFAIGKQVLSAGLVPIIEPELNIHCPEKRIAEGLLKTALLEELDKLEEEQLVIFKLTPPEVDNFYRDCIEHPRVLKVVALSGGYPREEANTRLARQQQMVASFSRALCEGLTIHQPEDCFSKTLDASIQSIFEASST